jgi:hypothetical protein
MAILSLTIENENVNEVQYEAALKIISYYTEAQEKERIKQEQEAEKQAKLEEREAKKLERAKKKADKLEQDAKIYQEALLKKQEREASKQQKLAKIQEEKDAKKQEREAKRQAIELRKQEREALRQERAILKEKREAKQKESQAKKEEIAKLKTQLNIYQSTEQLRKRIVPDLDENGNVTHLNLHLSFTPQFIGYLEKYFIEFKKRKLNPYRLAIRDLEDINIFKFNRITNFKTHHLVTLVKFMNANKIHCSHKIDNNNHLIAMV